MSRLDVSTGTYSRDRNQLDKNNNDNKNNNTSYYNHDNDNNDNKILTTTKIILKNDSGVNYNNKIIKEGRRI